MHAPQATDQPQHPSWALPPASHPGGRCPGTRRVVPWPSVIGAPRPGTARLRQVGGAADQRADELRGATGGSGAPSEQPRYAPAAYGDAFADVYDEWYERISDVDATVARVRAFLESGR